MANENYTHSDIFYAALISALEEEHPYFLETLLTRARHLSLKAEQGTLTEREVLLIRNLRGLRF